MEELMVFYRTKTAYLGIERKQNKYHYFSVIAPKFFNVELIFSIYLLYDGFNILIGVSVVLITNGFKNWLTLKP